MARITGKVDPDSGDFRGEFYSVRYDPDSGDFLKVITHEGCGQIELKRVKLPKAYQR